MARRGHVKTFKRKFSARVIRDKKLERADAKAVEQLQSCPPPTSTTPLPRLSLQIMPFYLDMQLLDPHYLLLMTNPTKTYHMMTRMTLLLTFSQLVLAGAAFQPNT